MFSRLVIFTLCGMVFCAEEPKNSKRSLASYSVHPWNSILEHSPAYPWNSNALSHGYFNPFSTIYSEKSAHFTAHDVATAVAAAKEATAAAALAQQKVQAAREQVLIQEKVAAAKEAAAHAAIQRSEALAAAAAAAHKSAVPAHAVNHFSSGPWSNAKPGYNHWG